MKVKPQQTIALENHLSLDIYDESKRLAGDRWLVSMVARIEIPVEEKTIAAQQLSPEEEQKIRQALGETVVFEQKINRIFIDQHEKERLWQTMVETFVNNNLQYLSRENFPQRFLQKKIRETIEKQRQRPR